MTLQDFNNKWIYQSDLEKYGVKELWEIPEPNKDGIFYGDCEDYAITLKREVAGFQNWEYWYCKLNNVGHCVLYNKMTDMVIDNNTQEATPFIYYCRIFTVTSFRKYKWYELLVKFTVGKVVRFFISLKRAIS